jgi:hypothetical protein
MRIRDRLFALATASLHQGRAGARDPSARAEADARPMAAPTVPPSQLPREVSEQMLQSVMSSQQRLHQTAEVLAAIGSAVVRAEAALRAPGSVSRRGTGPRRPLGSGADSGPKESFPALLGLANARGLDGGFLFAGADGAAPFASDGSFRGTLAPTILTLEGAPPALVISGSALTAAAPFALAVDVLPALDRALTVTSATRQRELCMDQLQRATQQITYVQSKLAHAIDVLAGATSVIEDAISTSAIAAEHDSSINASHLAQTFGALEAARSLAERTLAIFPTLT